MKKEYLECGKIINTHGVAGGVKLESWCDSPDVLADLERVSDHCSNIAVGIIDAASNTMNAHEVLRTMKAESEDYRARFEAYAAKYQIHAAP